MVFTCEHTPTHPVWLHGNQQQKRYWLQHWASYWKLPLPAMLPFLKKPQAACCWKISDLYCMNVSWPSDEDLPCAPSASATKFPLSCILRTPPVPLQEDVCWKSPSQELFWFLCAAQNWWRPQRWSSYKPWKKREQTDILLKGFACATGWEMFPVKLSEMQCWHAWINTSLKIFR